MKVRSGWTGPEGNFVGVSGKVNLDLTPVLGSGFTGFGGKSGFAFGPDFAQEYAAGGGGNVNLDLMLGFGSGFFNAGGLLESVSVPVGKLGSEGRVEDF